MRFDRLLGHFERLETVERHDEVFHATEKGRVYLAGLARQTRGLIEAYGAAFSAVLEDEELGTPKQLGKRAEEAFRRSELLGEAHRFEASSAATYANAFDALSRRGILERARREGSKESVFVRGPDFDALAGLCERLAAVLAAG